MSTAQGATSDAVPLPPDSPIVFGSQSTTATSPTRSTHSTSLRPVSTPTASSSRSIQRQTSRLLTRSSTDSLNTSITPDRYKSKGKAKAPSDTTLLQESSAASVLPSPSKKSQKAAIERIDGNICALDKSISSLRAFVDDGLLAAAQRHTDLSDVVSGLAEGDLPLNSSTRDITTLIQASNATVETVNELQVKVSNLTVAVAALRDIVTAQPPIAEAATTPPIAHAPVEPHRKRARIASTQPVTLIAFPWVSPPTPPANAVCSTPAPGVYPVAPNGVSYIPLPPNVPAPPPPSAAAVPPALTLTFGPVCWGKDITREFRSFLQLLPGANSIRAGSVRAHDHRGDYVFASFASEADCDRFISLWTNSPPPGFPGVTAQKN
jgi:hypothetical protein